MSIKNILSYFLINNKEKALLNKTIKFSHNLRCRVVNVGVGRENRRPAGKPTGKFIGYNELGKKIQNSWRKRMRAFSHCIQLNTTTTR